MSGAAASRDDTALPWLQAPLQQALATQRSHALLVQAAAGVGGFEFMLSLAQAWLCESGDTSSRPCHQCASCHLVHNHSHPDLYVLLPEVQRIERGWSLAGDGDEGARSRAKPSRQIRIDEVRAAIDWIGQTMSRGRAKVLLLHPAEAMNLQSASALLKTLEEPPGASRLLLGCSDVEHLLPTVRSRCQRLRLEPPAMEDAISWLVAQGVGQPEVLLRAAAGAPLQALALFNGGIDAARWSALPRAVADGRASVFSGWPLPQVLDALYKLCHDAMAVQASASPRYFSAEVLPAGANAHRLVDLMRTLNRVARHDEHPWNEGLLVEALVTEAAASWEDDTKGAATAGQRPRRGPPPLATLNR